MTRDLHAEIVAWLTEHEQGSAEEVARGVRARVSVVRVVLDGEGFESFSRGFAVKHERRAYKLVSSTGDGAGQPEKRSQAEIALSILRYGGWHGRAELVAAGVTCPNSRISGLRKLGHKVVCERRGRTYAYRLVSA